MVVQNVLQVFIVLSLEQLLQKKMNSHALMVTFVMLVLPYQLDQILVQSIHIVMAVY